MSQDEDNCSSSPLTGDSFKGFLSAELDSLLNRNVSDSAALQLTASRSSQLTSDQSHTLNENEEHDDWKKVSFFNPKTGTSIIKITAAMFEKSRERPPGEMAKNKAKASDVIEQLDSETHSPEPVVNGKSEETEEVVSGVHLGKHCESLKGNYREEDYSVKSNNANGHLGSFSSESLKNKKARSFNSSKEYDLNVVEVDENGFEVVYADEEPAAFESVVMNENAKLPDKEDELVTVVVDSHSGKTSLASQQDSDTSVYRRENSFADGDFKESFNEETRMKPGYSDTHQSDYNSNWVMHHSHVDNGATVFKLLSLEEGGIKTKPTTGPLRLAGFGKSSALPGNSLPLSTSRSANQTSNASTKSDVSSFISIPSLNAASSVRNGKGMPLDDCPKSASITDTTEDCSCVKEEHRQPFEVKSYANIPTSEDLQFSSDMKLPEQAISRNMGEPYSVMTNHYTTADQFNASNSRTTKKIGQKQKKQQKNAGFFLASQIEGYMGDRPIAEVLHFINGEKNHSAKSGKTSQKAKKKAQQNETFLKNDVKTDNNKSEHIFENYLDIPISVYKNSEESVVVDREYGESLNEMKPTLDVSATELVTCLVSNGLPITKEAVKKVSDAANQYSAFKVTEKNVTSDVVPNGVSLAEKMGEDVDNTVPSKYPMAETTADDAEKLFTASPTNSSSLESKYDKSSGLLVTTSDSELNEKFITVQKKKRTKNILGEKSLGGVEPADSASINARSRILPPYGSRCGSDASQVRSRNYVKAEINSKHSYHLPWTAVFRDKIRRGELQVKGSSSENSSTCSAPVFKDSASNFVASDRNLSVRKDPLAPRNSNSEVMFELDAYAVDGPNRIGETVTMATTDISRAVHVKTTSVTGEKDAQPKNAVPVNTSAPEDSGHVKTNQPQDAPRQMALPEESIPGKTYHGSVASGCSTTAAISSGRASSRPAVVFDTKDKAVFGRDVDFSFGFDPEDSEKILPRSSVIPAMGHNLGMSSCPENTANVYKHSAALDVNYNYQGAVTGRSALVSLSNHVCPTSLPLPLCNSMHSLPPATGYFMPVGLPVGIVPPIVVCDNRQPATTVIPCTTLEAKNHVLSPLATINVPAFSVSSKREATDETRLAENPSMVRNLSQTSSNVIALVPVKTESHRSPFNLRAAQKFLYSLLQDSRSQSTRLVLDKDLFSIMKPSS